MVGKFTRVVCRAGLVILLLGGCYLDTKAQDVRYPKCPAGTFSAKYYKNQDLKGRPALTRCERSVDFDWGAQGPKGEVAAVRVKRDVSRQDSDEAADIEDQSGKSDGETTAVFVGDDHFSARWLGRFRLAAGDYTFVATADDGITVWLDGENIINAWRVQAPTEYQATRSLTAGTHQIEVFYFESDGGAMVRLRWQRQ